jgi:hypothetical protein
MANRFKHLFTEEKKAEYRRNLESNTSNRGSARGFMELTQEGMETVDKIRDYYETHDDPEFNHVAPKKANRRH